MNYHLENRLKELSILNSTMYRWLTIIGLLLLTGSCSHQDDELKGHDYTPIKYFERCVSYDFEIDSLPYSELPNTNYSLTKATDTSFLRDSEGVMLYEYNNQTFYHPVNICHKLFALIDAFRQTNDTAHLVLLKKYVNRLITESMEFDGAIYYPYQIDYKVHQRDDGLLLAPWFSGMAQGEALGALIRTFIVTQDSIYLEFAHKTFNSFLRLRGEKEPWTVFVDTRGCYWIEEYPTREPSRTLNGFNYAIFGLYDYYQFTKNEQAKKILKSCFNTIKNYIPLFRRLGKPSFYNLGFRHYASDYHLVHIKQLRYFEKMTNDPFFGKWADSLQSDWYQ